MVGGEMEETSSEFWLPEDFLSDDFFAEKNDGGVGDGEGSNLSSPESEAEDDYVAGLTQKMADSFLLHDRSNSGNLYPRHHNPKNSVLGTSPQSTLRGMRGWLCSGSGSPEAFSQVASPPSAPFPMPPHGDEALDLLYAAAGQVARMRFYDQEICRHGGVLARPRSREALIQQQLQAARFYELRRQQLMKQQWDRYHQVGGGEMGPLGLSSSAWPPPQKHHQRPAHRAPAARPMLINAQRRDSKGTGVFLPRCAAGGPTEPRTKPANSPVLLPASVVQALNLNLDDVTLNPDVPGTYLIDHDALISRGNVMRPLRNRPAVASRHDLRLPTEWTY